MVSPRRTTPFHTIDFTHRGVRKNAGGTPALHCPAAPPRPTGFGPSAKLGQQGVEGPIVQIGNPGNCLFSTTKIRFEMIPAQTPIAHRDG